MYLKDKLNGMVRVIDDSTPRGKARAEKFLDTPTFVYKDGKATQRGNKWSKITKAEYEKALKE